MKAFNLPFIISAILLLAAASARALDTPAQPTAAPAANPPAYNHKDAGAAALSDVNKMLDAKVDGTVIVAYVRNCHVNFQLSAADIIALKDHGASPEVLTALLQSPFPANASVSAQIGAAQTAPAVEAPMTPSPDYSQTPGYSYPAYGYDYSSYPYYPNYYPSYAYYGYGWPYFYFSPFFLSPFHFHNHGDFHNHADFHNHGDFHNHAAVNSAHFHNGFVGHPWGTSGGLVVHGTTHTTAGGFHGPTSFHSFSGSSGFHSFSGGGGMHMGGGGMHMGGAGGGGHGGGGHR